MIKIVMNSDWQKKQALAPKVFENLLRYYKLTVEANHTALQLLAHPDTTANLAMETQAKLVSINSGYGKAYYATKKHFQNYEPHMWDWGGYIPLI